MCLFLLSDSPSLPDINRCVSNMYLEWWYGYRFSSVLVHHHERQDTVGHMSYVYPSTRTQTLFFDVHGDFQGSCTVEYHLCVTQHSRTCKDINERAPLAASHFFSTFTYIYLSHQCCSLTTTSNRHRTTCPHHTRTTSTALAPRSPTSSVQTCHLGVSVAVWLCSGILGRRISTRRQHPNPSASLC